MFSKPRFQTCSVPTGGSSIEIGNSSGLTSNVSSVDIQLQFECNDLLLLDYGVGKQVAARYASINV